MEPWMAVDAISGSVDAQMEPWRVRRPVMADSDHFYEEYPYMNQIGNSSWYLSEKHELDPH